MGSDNVKMEYQNPINARYFLSIVLPSALAFLLGIIAYTSQPERKALLGLLLFWAIGSFFLIGIMWKEYFHKPRSIVINDDGVILKLRFNRTVHINWNDILWISASSGKGVDEEGVSGRGGGIKANRGVFYSVTYEVGQAVRERYIQKMGRRPLTRAQYVKIGKGR